MRWQDHVNCFETVLNSSKSCEIQPEYGAHIAIKECTKHDPLSEQTILGAPSYSIAFLEFLFHKAQGPYSSDFEWIAEIIRIHFHIYPELQNLINLNAADALANMVLNRRGKLKFLICDQIELGIILEWWVKFGLVPITAKNVFDAILSKPTIQDRLRREDPLLLLRLLDVFPEQSGSINPKNLSKESLIQAARTITHPPSERRYHQIYSAYVKAGGDLLSIIKKEEMRILPMQTRRNRFLAYLVKQYYHNTCQICSATGEDLKKPVEVHHIIPLSKQGEDCAHNMIVTCIPHHRAIHDGIISLSTVKDTILINTPEKSYYITQEL